MAGYAEWAYLYYACARIGAVMVPVNTRYKLFEVEYVLNKSKAAVLILKDEEDNGKDYLGILKELCPELDASSPGRIASKRLPYLRHVMVIGKKRYPGCSLYDDLLVLGAGISQEALDRAERADHRLAQGGCALSERHAPWRLL